MRHSTRFSFFLACIPMLCLFASTSLATAQTVEPSPDSDWNSLLQQPLSRGVIVTTRDFSHHKGDLVMTSDEALTLRNKDGEITIPRDRVLRVQSRERTHRIRNALIGLGIGLGIGAAIGGYQDATRVAETGEELFFTRMFGFLGAASGGVIGLANPSHPILYRASKATDEDSAAGRDPQPPPSSSSLQSEHFRLLPTHLAYRAGFSGPPATDEHAAPASSPAQPRYLIIAVDGVGFDIVEEMYRNGEIENFPPPRPVINAFPSTTNPGLVEILQPLGAPVARGYEDVYFDSFSNKMRGSVLDRLSRKHFIETTFRRTFDYHPHQVRMTVEYAVPLLGPWLNARFSMARLKQEFLKSDKPVFLAYVASSDLAIHLNGKWLLRNLVKNFDQMAAEIKKESDVPVEIILYSDHGNLVTRWRRAGLGRALRSAGFKPGWKIEDADSVVLPQYGLISSAHIETAEGREADVAAALARAEGVDISAYRRFGKLHVVGRRGHAVIERRVVNDRVYFRYQTLEGDPLELLPVYGTMARNGVRDYDGFVAEDDWLRATAGHVYPDPLRRLWNGFDWVEQPVSLLVSLEDGYYTGSWLLDILALLQATHGNLRRAQSTGIVLSTDKRLFEDPSPFTGENLMRRIGRLNGGAGSLVAGRTNPVIHSMEESLREETCDICP